MTEDVHKFSYNLTHCYLEVARTATASVRGTDPKVAEFVKVHGSDPLANIVFSIISITVIYSYLAIESFVNYQLYLLWQLRNVPSPQSKRFVDEYDDIQRFTDITKKETGRSLGSKIKALSRIFGCKPPHEAIPEEWQKFKELSEESRHFLPT